MPLILITIARALILIVMLWQAAIGLLDSTAQTVSGQAGKNVSTIFAWMANR